MHLNLITLATVKTQLGISNTDYDTAITAMIPIVSNDVRRILNTNFITKQSAIITSGSAEIYISDNIGYKLIYTNEPVFDMGQILVNTSCLADETYITGFDPDTSIYTLSANATADGDYVYKSISIGMVPAISKMIFYKIGKMTTGSASAQKFKNIAYGNVRKEFAESEINKLFDYPQTFINELGVPYAVIA